MSGTYRFLISSINTPDQTVQKEALDIWYNHPYPFFFESGWNAFNNYATQLKLSGQSMLAHSGLHQFFNTT